MLLAISLVLVLRTGASMDTRGTAIARVFGNSENVPVGYHRVHSNITESM